MRLSSFKARIFFISVLVAILIVDFVRVTTYFVIAERMDSVARQESALIADYALRELRRDVAAALTAAQASAEASGKADPARVRATATDTFLSTAARQFSEIPGGLRIAYAFHDSAGVLRYRSSDIAVVDDGPARARALEEGKRVESHVGAMSSLHNLLFPAQLGVYVVHVPFELPDGKVWVLDTVYEPVREARTMDALRTPMIELAILSTLMTVGAMVGTTLWVLRLVDQLRVAADSVDAGRLDVRLPERGRNEIGDLGRSINELIDRLRKAGEAQTRFVADASHELATPVAGIRGHINILRSWGASDPTVAAEALDAIDRESRRMVRLTRQLLEMIRSEGTLGYSAVLRDINAIARRVLADAATRYADKNLGFEGPVDKAFPVWIDPDRIEQVLGILVDNAAKYTPAGGHVSVSTEAKRREVIIVVSDTGRGIPAEDLPSIFDRFYRADVSRASEGFGLGLSIAKRIVDTAGGTMVASSRIGRGTTFTIRLPDRSR
jgi:signal transduction histidine kinase